MNLSEITAAGIDVGAVSTKVVILKGEKILAKAIFPTKADPNLAARLALEKTLKESNLEKEEIKFIVATGYGRRAIEYGQKIVTEISCNAKGARFLGSPLGTIRTIIDLGGQDSKAISLDEEGNITGFAMNEKCLPFYEKIFVLIDGKPRLMNIGKLVEEELKIVNKKVQINSLPILIKPKRKIFAVSFDPETFRITYAPVTKLMKRKGDNVVLKITIEGRKFAYVSKDHPMITLTPGGIVRKKASNLKIGDYIPFAKKIGGTISQKRIERLRLKSHLAQLIKGDIHFAKVTKIEKISYNSNFYDIYEVNPYHNFMHGLGIFTSNCAAGTGRFLEVMANALDVRLEDLGELSLKSQNPIKINATCTVFAESEVISLIAQKKKKEDIIAGLHRSIAKRLAGLIREVGAKPIIFFDGGGAKNLGIKKALEEELGQKIYVPKDPEFVIALGAALIASELATSRPKVK